jgi:MFS family permease
MTDSTQPFAIHGFRLFWITRLCSTLAQTSLVVVIGWQVYSLARTSMGIREAALQLGLIGLAQFLPMFALTLVTGWVADRWDRRRIVQACTTLQLACAIVLALANLLHGLSLGILFGVAVLLGVARAFSMPALGAIAPNVVPRPLVPRAIAASSIATRVGAILGPAMGGYLYAAIPWAPYAGGVLLLVVSFVATAGLPPIRPPRMAEAANPWRQMIEGLTFVRDNRLVLGAISLDLFAVLLGGATAMLPIYAQDILHTGPTGLGHLRAAPALGAMLSAVWFSYRPLSNHIGIKMLAAVGIFGAATAIFGLSRSMPLSLASLVVLGAADMLSVYVRQSLIQLGTPDEMRGRVGAVSSLFVSASNELGEAESGFLAALVGPVTAVVAGGVGAVFVAILWARLFPMLRGARRFESID